MANKQNPSENSQIPCFNASEIDTSHFEPSINEHELCDELIRQLESEPHNNNNVFNLLNDSNIFQEQTLQKNGNLYSIDSESITNAPKKEHPQKAVREHFKTPSEEGPLEPSQSFSNPVVTSEFNLNKNQNIPPENQNFYKFYPCNQPSNFNSNKNKNFQTLMTSDHQNFYPYFSEKGEDKPQKINVKQGLKNGKSTKPSKQNSKKKPHLTQDTSNSDVKPSDNGSSRDQMNPQKEKLKKSSKKIGKPKCKKTQDNSKSKVKEKKPLPEKKARYKSVSNFVDHAIRTKLPKRIKRGYYDRDIEERREPDQNLVVVKTKMQTSIALIRNFKGLFDCINRDENFCLRSIIVSFLFDLTECLSNSRYITYYVEIAKEVLNIMFGDGDLGDLSYDRFREALAKNMKEKNDE